MKRTAVNGGYQGAKRSLKDTDCRFSFVIFKTQIEVDVGSDYINAT
jgi:hypothetical protein